ncbi:HupE/UreJ family protein [Candidatus Roizmanbacteria bacterium]|nr:HupE/UreJ family protein [Candidatus Roizmanbacteria bacterium]
MGKKTIFIFLACIVLLTAPSISAHELIPPEALEYIKDHPDATAEEIQQYIEQKSPGFTRKFKDKQEAIDVITNRQTSFFDSARDYLMLGIKHILGGKDHILFILSLLLTFVSLKQIVKLTSTFTLAHSITLILAGANILKLSTKIVEPLIAFSIAYVAIVTVLLKDKTFLSHTKYKVATVFFFGLFHGLGFAGLLQEIQIPKDKFFSSLISFNVGIELGQIIIISLIVPLLYLLKKKVWYGTFIKLVAIVLSIIATAWGIERIIS